MPIFTSFFPRLAREIMPRLIFELEDHLCDKITLVFTFLRLELGEAYPLEILLSRLSPFDHRIIAIFRSFFILRKKD